MYYRRVLYTYLYYGNKFKLKNSKWALGNPQKIYFFKSVVHPRLHYQLIVLMLPNHCRTEGEGAMALSSPSHM